MVAFGRFRFAAIGLALLANGAWAERPNERVVDEIKRITKWTCWMTEHSNSGREMCTFRTPLGDIRVEPNEFLAQLKEKGVPTTTDGDNRPRWEKHRLVILTDMEPDDRMALQLAAGMFSNAEILLVGTSVKHTGLKKMLAGRLLDQIGLTRVRVAAGTGGESGDYVPISGTAAARSYEKEGAGILVESIRQDILNMPHSSHELKDELKQIFETEDNLTLVVMSPAPDLEAVLEGNDRYLKKIKEAVLMGGWVDVPATETTPAAKRTTYNWNMAPEASSRLLQRLAGAKVRTTLWSSHVVKPHFKGGSVNRDTHPAIIAEWKRLAYRVASFQEHAIAGKNWDAHLVSKIPPLAKVIGPYQGEQFTPADPIAMLAVLHPQLIQASTQVDVAMRTQDLDPARGYAVDVSPNLASSVRLVDSINVAEFERVMLDTLVEGQRRKERHDLQTIQATSPTVEEEIALAEREMGGKYVRTYSDAGEPTFVFQKGMQEYGYSWPTEAITVWRKRNARLSSPRLAYFSDAEGNLPALEKFIESSGIFIPGTSTVREGGYFVFGGDAVDFGDSAGVLSALYRMWNDSWREMTLLVGNRDLNKVRLATELTEEAMRLMPAPRADGVTYEAYLASENLAESRGARLRWIFASMNAGGAFEARRKFLAAYYNRDISGIDDELITNSFVDEIGQGAMHAYLQSAKLLELRDGTLFLHASLTPQNFLHVPGKPKAATTQEWVVQLNEWYHGAYREFYHANWNYRQGRGSYEQLVAASQPLVAYSGPAPGRRDNPESVVFARDVDANQMNKMPAPEIVAQLRRDGIQRVVKGDWNSGSLPFVRRTEDASFELIVGDASRRRGSRAMVVAIDKLESGQEQVVLSGTDIQTDRFHSITYLHGEKSPLGRTLSSGGVIVGRENADWLVYRSDRNFADGYLRMTDAEVEADLKAQACAAKVAQSGD